MRNEKNVMRRVPMVATITALLLLSSSAALAAPPTDGCSHGFEIWSVANQPYQADDAVDQAGNDNGYVCARQLGVGLLRQYGTDLPIYLFVDDDHVLGN
jgi:hypothetical protein